MKPVEKRDSDESIKTTPTLRAKGKAISNQDLAIVQVSQETTENSMICAFLNSFLNGFGMEFNQILGDLINLI